MWQQQLDNHTFISQLYNEIPELINVRILNIKIDDEGDKVSIAFVMPKYADNPPQKWELLNYNSILVELNFYDINKLSFTSSHKKMFGDINIEITGKNLLQLTISGALDVKLEAGVGQIQSATGYIDSNTSKD